MKKGRKKFNQRGFTLPEILIVIGIVAILSAIAIPNLLRSRHLSNEAVAQSTLKTIAWAMENYLASNGTYPAATNDLTTPVPPYLSADYFTGTHNGYTFVANTLTNYTYAVTASPAGANFGTESYTITTGSVLTTN